MTQIFAGPDSPIRKFRAFSLSHLLTVVAIVLVNAVLIAFRSRISGTTLDIVLRWSFAAVLILNEAGLGVWRARHGIWTFRDSLPFHLCGVSVILVAVMLPLKSYGIFELTYFWAVGGALQGLITPDVEGFGFPHWRYLTTFISHGLIVTANLYMIFVLGMRPTFLSLLKSIVVLNIYGVLALVFNGLTKSNYGFLCRKPEQATLYDILGAWPWYLLSLDGLAIVISFLVYAPFLIFR